MQPEAGADRIPALIRRACGVCGASCPAEQGLWYGDTGAKTLCIARELGFHRLLCVCDEDNYASEKIILKNGGVLENTLYDPEEAVTVKGYWIDL